MKRIILFSTPTQNNIEIILEQLFPKEIEEKIFAYMPSDGANISQKYVEEWRSYADKYNASFDLINNSNSNSSNETGKLLDSNILVISGGNTFTLLSNLRKSGLDKAIKKFVKKKEYVLSGFSAGALVLTPTIKVCDLPDYDANTVGLKDLTGLGIIDFEVFPHYNKLTQKVLLNQYRRLAKNKVREISDEDFINIEL